MEKNLRFWNLKKRVTNQPTDRRTDGRTDPLIEMHLKIIKDSKERKAKTLKH